MKKLLFILILALTPFATFAGSDTDRICADTSKWGKLSDSLSVSYPGEKVSVENVYKVLYSQQRLPVYDENAKYRLYYMVNVGEHKIDSLKNIRSELYEYDCTSKTPKLLLSLNMTGNGGSYFTLDYQNHGNLVLAEKSFGMVEGSTERIVGYNIYKRKQLFDVKWNSKEGAVAGFAESGTNYYLYFSDIDFVEEGTIYSINKKTKKISKL